MVRLVWRRVALIGAGLLMSLVAGCGGGSGIAPDQLGIISREDTPLANRLTISLDRWGADTLQQADVISTTLLLDVPQQQYRYARAQGLANPQTGETMSMAYPFRVASISKVFTATVVLQLVEEGYLTLDTPLSRLLDNTLLPAGYTLDDLHVMGGVKAGGSITVRQLLQHTAGLRDYLADTPTAQDGNGLFAQMIGEVLSNNGQGLASRQWNGRALLGYYLSSGLAANALAAPGRQFEYSDTHYLLLGLVIEQVTGQSLSANYRGRIFNRLGMVNTWHEGFETGRGRLAHHFYNLVAQGNNLDITATSLNTSAAWASGALVSTTEDLTLFLRALMHRELFRERTTLQLMRQTSGVSPNYGLGLQRAVFNGREMWGHAGFWGTMMLYDPANDTALVMTVNQANRDMFKEVASVFAATQSAGL
ncbi:D-alanyl-D-alanine carboxypeptidase [Thiothrix caldifontis]|uniref:D-alanyl-D-alanine carboxypeptidase n=1 Tax=Thiothrix caldifontis TaxID=525918 RepID=A0A1H3WAJ9_9GAMM|nr:serine hydrolase domain-containing protein [Thiothrix caldifontis]SDZ84143.1 D-alanyl-D-alanine carboxypeptidase [Thiothrix caldifontis]